MKNIAAKRKIFLIISAAAMVLVVLVAVVMGPSMGLELGGGTVGIYAYSTGTTLAPADFENTAEEYLGSWCSPSRRVSPRTPSRACCRR